MSLVLNELQTKGIILEMVYTLNPLSLWRLRIFLFIFPHAIKNIIHI